jgi:septal ring factor EnvC (AmiA/AmiB activator)
MYYSKETYIKNLFAMFLFVVVSPIAIVTIIPATMAAASSGAIPEQVDELQAELVAAHEKIALITAEQQKAAQAVSSLQTDLQLAHQEICQLKADSELNNQFNPEAKGD